MPERSRKIGAAIFNDDRAAQHLGIALEDIRPGFARMRMQVRPEMANSHGIGHGGLTFALADTAMAYAANAHNQRSVAQSILVHYLAPTRPGDVLTATAEEINRTRRTGLYDVVVTNQDGARVAVLRGTTQTIKGENLPGAD
jgi:acyl-CoA thioesterase